MKVVKKGELISRIGRLLREYNIRKSVRIPSHSFWVTDEDGQNAKFTVKKNDRVVEYTQDDIKVILDILAEVIQKALMNGESVSIHGLGTFRIGYRKPAKVRHPKTKDVVDVPGHYVVKFDLGAQCKTAVSAFNSCVAEGLTEPPDADDGGDDDGIEG